MDCILRSSHRTPTTSPLMQFYFTNKLFPRQKIVQDILQSSLAAAISKQDYKKRLMDALSQISFFSQDSQDPFDACDLNTFLCVEFWIQEVDNPVKKSHVKLLVPKLGKTYVNYLGAFLFHSTSGKKFPKNESPNSNRVQSKWSPVD